MLCVCVVCESVCLCVVCVHVCGWVGVVIVRVCVCVWGVVHNVNVHILAHFKFVCSLLDNVHV